MSTWRCPNCGTFQAESTNCFLCGRSATSCATCLNFRESVVGGLGYCAIDKRHEPLTGAEQRACWTSDFSTAVHDEVTTDSVVVSLFDLTEARVADVHPSRGALKPVSGQ